MAISLQDFFLGQKVYAQETTPPPIDGSLDGSPNYQSSTINSNQNTNASSCSTDLNKQYKDLCISSKKIGNNETGLCYMSIKEKDPKKTQDCSKVSNTDLTNAFCGGEKDIRGTQLIRSKSNDSRSCICPNGYVVGEDGTQTKECLMNTAGDLGINCGPEQLKNGTCTWNINKTLGIRSSETTPNPTLLLQDVVLGATSFIGTLIMIALVVMGVKYVQGGFDESSTGDLKGNIKKLLIGLFLVIGSYTIIRIVQYVARGY